ncbi:MAG: YcgL domain-containing protein [Alcanivoracaceae bacterium]|nr:YcgL domain-containing protein [Alcanivoracaceae bacterium]
MSADKIFCSVYRSSKREEMYLYVQKDTDLAMLPEPLVKQFGQATLAMNLVLSATRKLARADVQKVMQQIEEQGFYLQMPPSETVDALLARQLEQGSGDA